jgi:hypothetical protein
VISVSPEIRQAVADRLTEWAEEHPADNRPVITYRGHPFLPRDLVLQVAEPTELGGMFLHSLYTSYLIRREADTSNTRMTKETARRIMDEHTHSNEYISDVDLHSLLAPIEQMILDNRRRG